MKAKTSELREYYIRNFGAIPFSHADPFMLLIDGEAAKSLFLKFLEEEYLKLDELAAPDGYVAPSTSEDLAYIAYFRQTCNRYNIDFASADQDERDFVIRMAQVNCSKNSEQ